MLQGHYIGSLVITGAIMVASAITAIPVIELEVGVLSAIAEPVVTFCAKDTTSLKVGRNFKTCWKFRFGWRSVGVAVFKFGAISFKSIYL